MVTALGLCVKWASSQVSREELVVGKCNVGWRMGSKFGEFFLIMWDFLFSMIQRLRFNRSNLIDLFLNNYIFEEFSTLFVMFVVCA